LHQKVWVKLLKHNKKAFKKIHNPDLDIEGLLLTMFDSRLRLSNQVVEEVQKHFNDMVLTLLFKEM
jgi:chromosome partitioning protein